MPANRCTALLVLLSLMQVLCATFLLRWQGFTYINSALFFICGVASSYVLMKAPALTISLPRLSMKNSSYRMKFAICFLLLITLYFFCRKILDATPVAIENADMLPIIKVMGQRFLRGEWKVVYSPIQEIWNGVQPIYPPALWMSFLPAQLFAFDLRWITVSGLYMSLGITLFILPFKRSASVLQGLVLTALLLVLIWLLSDATNNVIRLSEEGIIYLYYMLMVIAIVSKSGWWIGAMAAVCLLSRFAIIGWLPCLAVYWLVTKEYVTLLKAIAAGSGVVLLLLIIPFGWKPITVFAQLPSGYVAHAQRVWATYPQHFYQSLGLAKFFGPSHAALLHQLLIGCSFSVPLLFLFFCIQQRKKQLSPNFLLASFQLTLTVFYNFIDVSYLYLFYTPVLVSLAIACVSINAQWKDESVVEN